MVASTEDVYQWKIFVEVAVIVDSSSHERAVQSAEALVVEGLEEAGYRRSLQVRYAGWCHPSEDGVV